MRGFFLKKDLIFWGTCNQLLTLSTDGCIITFNNLVDAKNLWFLT